MILRSKADLPGYFGQFYPQYAELLPNGHLQIPWSGVGDEGEKIDGRAEVHPDYPDYPAWLHAMHRSNAARQ